MRETIQKIYAAISADATLTAYVKSFSMGGLDEVTRLLFPFVNIGTIEDYIDPLTIGPTGRGNQSTFSVSVTFGIKSTIPELAYYGDDANGIKGILHMCDDLKTICAGNMFDGAFYTPALVRRVRTDYVKSSADWVWVGEIAIEGRRKEVRSIKC